MNAKIRWMAWGFLIGLAITALQGTLDAANGFAPWGNLEGAAYNLATAVPAAFIGFILGIFKDRRTRAGATN